MARDYAKRYKTAAPKRRSKKSTSRSSLRGIFVIIVILLVIASGIAGYFYYHQPKVPTSLLPPVSEAKATPLKKARPKAPVVEAKEEPVDYEFYTLLPKINVPDPVLDTTPPDQQPGFWLQMAVYYSMRDASAMLDRLQLLGLDPVITEKKSTKSDKTLYIVVMGPYPTKEAAVARQQELKKVSVTSYIFHVDPPVVNTPPSDTGAMSNDPAVPVSDAVAD